MSIKIKTLKTILAGLALALLIASPVYGKAGASITAPDGLVFGQTFSVAFVPANGPDKDYWARADCYANASTQTSVAIGAPVYAQYVHLEPGIQQGPFTLGPTPSWSGGGATCTVKLLAFSYPSGTFSNPLATDDFTVAP